MTLRKVDLFSSNAVILWIVVLSVSILSVRYLPADNAFFQGMLLPYTVLGAAIIIFLPMLVYFLFVNTAVPGDFGRRFAWFLYGVVFLVLWGMRSSDIGATNWIYGLGLAFVLLNFIFGIN